MGHSLITPETLAPLRAKIGKPVQRTTMPFYTEINSDAARHFANAIGDNNPLHTDPEYGASTRWKGQLAPPTILYSTNNALSGAVEGLPGVHAMFAGTEFDWTGPVRVGTKVRSEVVLKDLVEHKTRFAGTAIQQIYTVKIFNRDTNALLCSADSWCFRTERDTARERGTKYGKDLEQIKPYTDAEVKDIYKQYLSEAPRGKTPLYFEDVKAGQKIGPIFKGPYTVTASIGFLQAWGSYAIHGNRIAWQYYHRHPKLAIPNDFNIPEPPVRVHWDTKFAREVGVPAPYDYGPERIAWLGHMMTDWMGDHAWLKSLHVQVRGHNLVGDLTTCVGEVTDKTDGKGEGVIEAQVQATNQHGRVTAIGTAKVVLPKKA